MIARLLNVHRPQYMALHLDKRVPDSIWVAIRDDRGRMGEVDAFAALCLCANALQTQMRSAMQAMKQLCKLSDRRHELSDQELRTLHSSARNAWEMMERVWMNLERLADQPTSMDWVDIDAKYLAVEPNDVENDVDVDGDVAVDEADGGVDDGAAGTFSYSSDGRLTGHVVCPYCMCRIGFDGE